MLANHQHTFASQRRCAARTRPFSSGPCPHAAGSRQGQRQHHRKRCLVLTRASEKAAALLAEGKRVYESGDRLAAMQIYEKALAEGPALSQDQRLAAMFGTIAVHASFGDVELAQMALRDAVSAGLDYESALDNPDNPQIQSSPQILIQLTRFNKQYRRSIEERAEDLAAGAVRAKAVQQRAGGSSTRVSSDADVTRLLGAIGRGQEASPGTTVDASPAAIAKRVALVVLAGIGLGVVLFFLGLEYMFPKL